MKPNYDDDIRVNSIRCAMEMFQRGMFDRTYILETINTAIYNVYGEENVDEKKLNMYIDEGMLRAMRN